MIFFRSLWNSLFLVPGRIVKQEARMQRNMPSVYIKLDTYLGWTSLPAKMHPCSVVEMRSDLSISPTNMDRTGIVRFGIVWNGMEWYLKWQHMVWLHILWYVMVQCSMAGFGMVWTRWTHRKPHLRPLLVLNFVQLQDYSIAAFAFAEASYQDRRLTLYQWRV